MPTLTQKQAELLQFIKNSIAEDGFSPTKQEMAEYFEILPNAINGRISGLEKKGALKSTPGIARSIIPVKGFRVRIKAT